MLMKLTPAIKFSSHSSIQAYTQLCILKHVKELVKISLDIMQLFTQASSKIDPATTTVIIFIKSYTCIGSQMKMTDQ